MDRPILVLLFEIWLFNGLGFSTLFLRFFFFCIALFWGLYHTFNCQYLSIESDLWGLCGLSQFEYHRMLLLQGIYVQITEKYFLKIDLNEP